jgi:hypothetical protein
MHGFPDWLIWLLFAIYYLPYVVGGLAVAGAIYVAQRLRNKK